MSPTIRVDQEVYEALQKQARPFVDTPNSVLRRVLGVEAADRSVTSSAQGQHRRHAERPAAGNWPARARSGSLLNATEYRGPILRALAAKGGAARPQEVVEAVGEELKDRLTPTDRETLASGNVRWKNRVMWARFHLAKSGLIDNEGPRGIWSLTDAGHRVADSA